MKKAQIKLWTTIAILIVFFVILMIGFIFYTQVERISLERSQTEADAARSIAVAQVVVNLPELQCSIGAVEKGICFDLYKVLVFEDISTHHWTHYYDIFGYADISVKQIEPTQYWDLYNNPKKNASYTIGYIPISLYNATNKEFLFGYIEVKSYYD